MLESMNDFLPNDPQQPLGYNPFDIELATLQKLNLQGFPHPSAEAKNLGKQEVYQDLPAPEGFHPFLVPDQQAKNRHQNQGFNFGEPPKLPPPHHVTSGVAAMPMMSSSGNPAHKN